MQYTGKEDEEKEAKQDDVTGPVLLSQGDSTDHRYTTAGYKSFW